jgi:hypothetical protein
MNFIHNERIKLLATALNNLGIGAILAGIVAPLVNGTLARLDTTIVWLALGVDLIRWRKCCWGGFGHEPANVLVSRSAGSDRPFGPWLARPVADAEPRAAQPASRRSSGQLHLTT